ncbi:MAG: hypothetical protein JWP20_727 [Roseomonas sp.]|nr:hypothetical protein [Roseomonas sp.]
MAAPPPLARQMGGQRTPRWPAQRWCRGPCASLALGLGRVLGHCRDELAEFQFQLVGQLAAALGGGAELVVPQLGDDQLEMRDHGLRAGRRPRRQWHEPAAMRASRSAARAARSVSTSSAGSGAGVMARVNQTAELTARTITFALTGSARSERPVGVLRVPPVDALQHVGQLRAGDGHHAIGR